MTKRKKNIQVPRDLLVFNGFGRRRLPLIIPTFEDNGDNYRQQAYNRRKRGGIRKIPLDN